MKLTLFNTLSRKKEPFVPIKKGRVGMYTCGPTVYNYAHLGNLRSYIFEDLLKRTLLFNNFKVRQVMNITDVGHLTSDADAGMDKMLLGAKRENKSVLQIADFYTKAFKEDLTKLNIIPPDIWCKATEHIKEQISLIKKLEKKGFTYSAGGNIYFDTGKLKDYGKLARLDLKAQKYERVEKDANKKNPSDFVLWFTKSKFQDQELKWNSPFGTGYPGWHVECSAMAIKYLGEQFDIHCGGIDRIPVHHTNEIAQSEAAVGKKPWVKYWLHNEFLVLEGQKMAKSGENFITLSTLQEKGFDPLDYRYFCLGTHYRKPLMFGFEALEGARNARKKLFDKILGVKNSNSKENKIQQKKYLIKYEKEINNDLNTPKALAVFWEMLNSNSLSDRDKYILALNFDKVLGFNLGNLISEKIPLKITKLAEERLLARNNKDWKKADQLREEIKKLGYNIGDTEQGYEITKA